MSRGDVFRDLRTTYALFLQARPPELNCAVELGHAGNLGAWRVKALADDVEDDGETAVFLSPKERKAVIDAAEPATAALARGLELTGARPKKLAATVVGDFDGKTLRLSHHTKAVRPGCEFGMWFSAPRACNSSSGKLATGSRPPRFLRKTASLAASHLGTWNTERDSEGQRESQGQGAHPLWSERLQLSPRAH